MAELVSNLGYRTRHGKNYKTVEHRLQQLNISTEHFTPYTPPRIINESDVFCQNSTVSQNSLRRFYLRREDIERKCAECGIGPEWNGKPLTLQIDHIDGDNKNNLLDNLQLLCPNCHSQTKTFAGKNGSKEKTHYFCVDCGKEITDKATRCVQCASILRQQINPSKEDLLSLLQSHNGNFKAVANIYNVVDNTIRRWCKKYGLPFHTSDYKEKKLPKEKKPPQLPLPCYMIDQTTNEIIKEFASRAEAARFLGLDMHKGAVNIGRVCNGKRKTAYGYKWKNKE